MSERKIVAVVGMSGAGKGTCTDYIHATYDCPIIHFGNMVYDEVQRRGLSNVDDEIFVREDMRRQEGPAVLAKHVAKKIDQYFRDGETRIVLDGLYSWSEYKYLHGQYGDDLIVVAVAAPKAMRRKRVLDRKDKHRKYTLNQLIKREVAEIEHIEKGGPIAYADYTIVNDDDANKLIEKLTATLKETGFIN